MAGCIFKIREQQIKGLLSDRVPSLNPSQWFLPMRVSAPFQLGRCCRPHIRAASREGKKNVHHRTKIHAPGSARNSLTSKQQSARSPDCQLVISQQPTLRRRGRRILSDMHANGGQNGLRGSRAVAEAVEGGGLG